MYTYEELREKDIVLLGISKFQSDFEYIFYDLSVRAYIDDSYTQADFNGKAVYRADDMNTITLRDRLIVICDFYDESRRKMLEGLALTYQRDFIFGSDVFTIFDNEVHRYNKLTKERLLGKKIIIMGTGVYYGYFSKDFPDVEAEYFIDNNPKKWDTDFCGKKIKPVDAILEEKKGCYLLIVASSSVIEIDNQLKAIGLEKDEDYTFYQKAKYLPSELLTKTFKDQRKTDFICKYPYEFAIVEVSGDVFPCRCSAWVSLPIGNLRSETYDKFMNSIFAKIFRLSMVNGTYSFCDANQCYLLADAIENNTECTEENKGAYGVYTEKYPATVAATYDFTCNLACRSCRRDFQAANDSYRQTMEQIHGNFVESILPNTDTLFLAGNGEVFISKYYRDLLEKYKGKNLVLQSNGILFDEKEWSKIAGRFESVDLLVSIDAASKETYKKLRGADFDVLLKNLRFASKLRINNELSCFKINFVAQKDNFREIIDFVKLGLELKVDEIYFCKLLNFGAYTEEEYKELNVFDPEHPNYPEAKEILMNPILKEKSVNIGNLIV